MPNLRVFVSSLLGAFVCCIPRAAQGDSTWVYAVQLSASIQESPAQITLNWQPDQYSANSYTVYRKAKDDTSWGYPLAVLPGDTTAYTDTQVSSGQGYEYQVAEDALLGYHSYGYIYSGIRVPPTESRGTVVLVVASDVAGPVAPELAQLQNDLVGDGWQLVRHDVSVDDTPESIRAIIRADYLSNPGSVNTVFLFGHVPVLHSGYLNYDSHGYRAMAADGFYGDMNDDWPTDPASSPSFFPSDVSLMVGRVDFYDMPGIGASPAWPSETDLLRQYLNKDHAWRFKALEVPRRALMANRLGDIGGIAPAATGYRAFDPLVGPGNTIEANVSDAAPQSERWISFVTTGAYLWTFGGGGGTDSSISQLGFHGLYNDVWSTDVVGMGAKAIFVMLDGSHFADWDHPDNILRAVLATPTYGLTACLAGGPHWYMHHMGLGETIGYSTRLTMNNSSLYQNQSNYLARAIYINLMGDPTLRMEALSPPSNLSVSQNGGSVNFSWSASPDANAGHLLYRATSASGPFTRVTGPITGGTSFTDTPGAGTFFYMVRALGLQTNPSGSYYNLSQGVFASVNMPGTIPAMTIQVSRVAEGVSLTWNSQPGAAYHVEATGSMEAPSWQDFSGTISAGAGTTTWIDSNASSASTRFYRVVSP